MQLNPNQSSGEVEPQVIATHRGNRGKSFKKMTFEDSLTEVGAQNWYQIRCFIVFCLQWVMTAFILSSGPFLFYTPSFDCSLVPNGNSCTADKCDYICDMPSDQWRDYLLDPGYIQSITMSMEPPLICSRTLLKTVLSTASFIGSFIGFFLFSWIADNKGRIPCLRYSWLVASIGALIMGVSNNPGLIFIGYFLAGFGANPAITVQYSFMNQHSQGQFREYSNIGVQMAFALGEIFYVGLAYWFPDWKILVIYITAIPMLLLNLGNLLIFESPKFLMQRNIIDAIGILNRIARVNQQQQININMMQSVLNSPQQQESRSIQDFFQYPSLTQLFICAVLVFFSVQAVYYGVLFIMGKVGINVYVNCLIIFSAEFLAYSVTEIFIPRLQRKQSLLFGFGIQALLCYAFLFLSGSSTAVEVTQIVLAGCLRFTVCFVWTVIYIFFSELFPTVVRSLALGITSAGGSIGSELAPFLVNLGVALNVTPMVFFGSIALMAVFCVSPLRETLNKPLMNNILQEERQEDILGIQKQGEFQSDAKGQQTKQQMKIGGETKSDPLLNQEATTAAGNRGNERAPSIN